MADGGTQRAAAILPLLRARGVRAVSANGVLGDPAGASAAEGKTLLARLVSGLNEAIGRMLAGAGGTGRRRT